MYGLLLENLATFIKSQWGEENWEAVRRHAGIDTIAFSIHHVYSETLMQRLARSCFQVLGVDERQFFEALGLYFVQYVSQYGYDQILSVLGRHMRDFLNGLDNLHEYLKFSYPKMRAPSFYCDEETNSGLKLHYRSKRRGFVYYVMGQIKQVANQFYKQDCEIVLISEELVGEAMHVVFQLIFDNSAFTEAESIRGRIATDLQLPVQAATLFELFPFCIVFNQDMEITHTGHALMTILKDLVGQIMTEAFDMIRPLIPFCFSSVMQRRNNIFELVTVAPIHDVNPSLEADYDNPQEETEGPRLHIRGQMLYMQEWDMMLYLANPVMPDLGSLVAAGLFVNDLSLHDCSRDFVLAGTQQSVELKLALDQEQQKSRKLVESMKKLDTEMRRTDELLYQMIPKQVADRIRQGENPVDTCQTFEMVSILFSDVVNFTDICSKISPMQVVNMLNHMYSLFDQLTERNGVYKVETIGDSYMVVSGAPEVDSRHAEKICDMALDMVDATEAIEDPSEEATSLKVRIGCHSGTVVGGVVGLKMPRYCLFGDTVNMASRMESTADASRIQISEACKNFLPSPYQIEFRGDVPMKGKGAVSTFWLTGRKSRIPLSKYRSKTISWSAPVPTVSESISRPKAPLTFHQNMEFRTDSARGLEMIEMSPTAASGTARFPRTDFRTNDHQSQHPDWRSTVTRSCLSKPSQLSSSLSASTLLNSFVQTQTAIPNSQNIMPSAYQLRQTDLINSPTQKEDISSMSASGKIFNNFTLKLEGKQNTSRKSKLLTDDCKEIPPADSKNVDNSCKSKVLFFHNCLAAEIPVDNPNGTRSPGNLLVKKGTKKRQGHGFEQNRTIEERHERGRVLQISKNCTGIRRVDPTENRTISQACSLL